MYETISSSDNLKALNGIVQRSFSMFKTVKHVRNWLNHGGGANGPASPYQYVDFCSTVLFNFVVFFFFFFLCCFGRKLDRALQQFMKFSLHICIYTYEYIPYIYIYIYICIVQIYFLTLAPKLYVAFCVCVCVVPIAQNSLFFSYLQMVHKHFFMFRQIKNGESK